MWIGYLARVVSDGYHDISLFMSLLDIAMRFDDLLHWIGAVYDRLNLPASISYP